MPVKLQKFAIADFRQFRNNAFDFTDPATGKPLPKVCFIGGNGTGKSTLLRLLWEGLHTAAPPSRRPEPKTLTEFAGSDAPWQRLLGTQGRCSLFRSEFDSLRADLAVSNPFAARAGSVDPPMQKALLDDLASTIRIQCASDSELAPGTLGITDVPRTNLNAALKLLRSPVTRLSVGQASTAAFWTHLIATIKDREARLLEYTRLPQNQERTIREVEEEFLRDNPDILKELADFWNVLLEKAHLEFDHESAAAPIQLTDNLKAYIRLKTEKQRIPYAELSTGIRNFIFKLGHIFSIFRGKLENQGIILVDEPENSLHPDFLYDLVAHYQQAAPGAQLFMATHNPIIAAQFRPEERFILEFDDAGGVTVRRGVSPEGDDPNDLLLRDFAVRTLYGSAGLEKWRRFRELDRLIQQEADPATRRALMTEYLEIGRHYNFSPEHEVSA